MEKKKFAFTLAEVLITLTILGVVAAITIPNMIQNYKKRVTITKLQKAYSTLESAAANIKASTGCENVQCLQKFGWREMDITSSNWQTSKLQENFAKAAGFPPQAIKIVNQDGWICVKAIHCETMECDETCPSSNDMKHLYGTILIKDGIWYNIGYHGTAASNPRFKGPHIFVGVGTEYKKDKKYKAGRNYFEFTIYDNFNVAPSVYGYGGSSLYPAVEGIPLYKKTTLTDNIYLFCNPTQKYTSISYSGNSCAARIIKDGWKMKY